MQLDHLILPVNDRDASIEFYERILGLRCEGESGPFSVIRVTPDLTVQLAPWGTTGGQHLAFTMPRPAFDAALARIQEAGVPYGDLFHSVGNMRGPGREDGARGVAASLYVMDPNEHLIEIRHYDDESGPQPGSAPVPARDDVERQPPLPLLDHLSLQCEDVGASASFYDAVLAPLGAARRLEFGPVVGFGVDRPTFWLGPLADVGTNRPVHVAFQASDRAAVRMFFDAAVAAGAEVLHEPRVWPEYHASYYGAFVRDPDGNNVEAVCHRPE